jgi:hypothetical protein
MSDAVLNKLVERLELVVKRLEAVEGKVGATVSLSRCLAVSLV